MLTSQVRVANVLLFQLETSTLNLMNFFYGCMVFLWCVFTVLYCRVGNKFSSNKRVHWHTSHHSWRPDRIIPYQPSVIIFLDILRLRFLKERGAVAFIGKTWWETRWHYYIALWNSHASFHVRDEMCKKQINAFERVGNFSLLTCDPKHWNTLTWISLMANKPSTTSEGIRHNGIRNQRGCFVITRTCHNLIYLEPRIMGRYTPGFFASSSGTKRYIH